ncbi:hypothetical protein RRSWK_03005 [Rhodopirellula sp. SWK7]|nr:hypothetical protein RRSWK_03005 [Rhodopirellula sp. SWK7]
MDKESRLATRCLIWSPWESPGRWEVTSFQHIMAEGVENESKLE